MFSILILSTENAKDNLTTFKIALGSVIRTKTAPICRLSRNTEKDSQVKKLLFDEKKFNKIHKTKRDKNANKAPQKPQFSIESPSCKSYSSI